MRTQTGLYLPKDTYPLWAKQSRANINAEDNLLAGKNTKDERTGRVKLLITETAGGSGVDEGKP